MVRQADPLALLYLPLILRLPALTCRRLQTGHFKSLGLDDLNTRAAGDWRNAAGDGVDAVEGTGEDEVLVRGEFCAMSSSATRPEPE